MGMMQCYFSFSIQLFGFWVLQNTRKVAIIAGPQCSTLSDSAYYGESTRTVAPHIRCFCVYVVPRASGSGNLAILYIQLYSPAAQVVKKQNNNNNNNNFLRFLQILPQ